MMSIPQGAIDARIGLPWRRRPALALMAILVLASHTEAVQPEKASPAPGRRALFNGKNLDGWKNAGFLSGGEAKVEEGMIVIAAGKSMSGITCTLQDLPTTNYELSYEAMRVSGLDFFAAATFPVGTSFITLVNGGWGGGVTGLSSLDGMDASENETTKSFQYKEKTWYRFRVRVTAKMIRAAIDGKELIAVNHQERRVGTRIETRRNQPLGFATWETAGAIRNIEVRPLTTAEIAETDTFEE